MYLYSRGAFVEMDSHFARTTAMVLTAGGKIIRRTGRRCCLLYINFTGWITSWLCSAAALSELIMKLYLAYTSLIRYVVLIRAFVTPSANDGDYMIICNKVLRAYKLSSD